MFLSVLLTTIPILAPQYSSLNRAEFRSELYVTPKKELTYCFEKILATTFRNPVGSDSWLVISIQRLEKLQLILIFEQTCS